MSLQALGSGSPCSELTAWTETPDSEFRIAPNRHALTHLTSLQTHSHSHTFTALHAPTLSDILTNIPSLYTHNDTCVHTLLHTAACTHTHSQAYACKHTDAHSHMHTLLHTHAHTYLHTRKNTLMHTDFPRRELDPLALHGPQFWGEVDTCTAQTTVLHTRLLSTLF